MRTLLQTLDLFDGSRIRVFQDEVAEDPRTAWTNLGHMVCWHSKYNIGDKHGWRYIADFQEWADDYGTDNLVLLPVYMYDHGSCALSTSNVWPFNDRWDARQVGWIYVTHEEIEKEFGTFHKDLEKVKKILRAEVSLQSAWINGNVVGYHLEGPPEKCGACGNVSRRQPDETLWGFYITGKKDSGLLESLPEEYQAEAKTGLRFL